MDSLKKELVDSIQTSLTQLKREARTPGGEVGEIRVEHINLVTNISISTPAGPRYFSVTVKEHLT